MNLGRRHSYLSRDDVSAHKQIAEWIKCQLRRLPLTFRSARPADTGAQTVLEDAPKHAVSKSEPKSALGIGKKIALFPDEVDRSCSEV